MEINDSPPRNDKDSDPAASHNSRLKESPDQPATGRQRDWTKGLLALIDQGFVSLNNFVTFILVAQFCQSRGDVNLYVLAWSIFNILRVIQERGLAAPYFVFSHERGRDVVTFLGSSLIHQSIFAALSGIFFALLAGFFSWWSTPAGMVGSSMILIVAAPFILLRDHLRAISCAHFRYGVAVFLSATAMILQISIIVGCYLWSSINVVVVFAAMGLSSLIPCAIWLLVRPQPFKVLTHRVVEDWIATSSYSKWLVAARFFPSAAMGLMPWIVVWAIDENAAGTLGSCITLANISNMFVFGANYFFLPKAVQALNNRGKSAMLQVLWQTAAVFGFVLSALCAFYWLLGDQVLGLAFGNSFTGHATLVTVIGLSFLIVSFSTIAGNGMTAIGKPEGLFWGELAFGIVAMIAGWFLANEFGLIGAAVAMCLAAASATIVEGVYLFKTLDMWQPDTIIQDQK